MKVPGESRGIGASLMQILGGLPVLSCYAKARGWPYIIAWLHRFTGIGLTLILIIYIYTLSSLQTPDGYNIRMKNVASSICLFLAGVSSLVVGFHALNGGRLLLYEIFGRRSDEGMIRWIFGLTAAYAAIVGLMMIVKNQHVSAFFFWLVAFFFGAVAAYVVESRIWEKRHSLLWKLQRISAAFLFITVPAYLLFVYLNPGVTSGAQGTIALMQGLFVRLVALVLASGALYHAGYGLFSIAADYVSSRAARAGMMTLIIIVIAVLAVFAFRVILSV
jgi:succinate dehydrogenase hydrophobic anchor subunit